MPQITYVQPGGGTRTILVNDGQSVMRAAVENSIDGIVGECGGNAMCATCHVYVEQGETNLLGEVGLDEDEMLDCTAAARLDSSRLSCQLSATSDLTVRIPEEQ
jgi:2Fe-2S ferredoxin